VRVKCLAQEHKVMSPARARTQTARSGDQRPNHDDTEKEPGNITINGSRDLKLNCLLHSSCSSKDFVQMTEKSRIEK